MKRGEIWSISLDPTVGSEICKTHPAMTPTIDGSGSIGFRAPLRRSARGNDKCRRRPDRGWCPARPWTIDIRTPVLTPIGMWRGARIQYRRWPLVSPTAGDRREQLMAIVVALLFGCGRPVLQTSVDTAKCRCRRPVVAETTGVRTVANRQFIVPTYTVRIRPQTSSSRAFSQ